MAEPLDVETVRALLAEGRELRKALEARVAAMHAPDEIPPAGTRLGALAALRAERDALRAEVARLRAAIGRWERAERAFDPDRGCPADDAEIREFSRACDALIEIAQETDERCPGP